MPAMNALFFLIACLGFAWDGNHALAAFFGLLSYGTAAVSISMTYDARIAAGRPIPRWLAWLELQRECLASEDGPEIRRGGSRG